MLIFFGVLIGAAGILSLILAVYAVIERIVVLRSFPGAIVAQLGMGPTHAPSLAWVCFLLVLGVGCLAVSAFLVLQTLEARPGRRLPRGADRHRSRSRSSLR
jgi:hypothetical protein